MYVPHVKALMATSDDHTILSASELVAEAAMKQRSIVESRVPNFISSLRKEFYRQRRPSAVTIKHGNHKLTKEEDDLLIGYGLGMTRCGVKSRRNGCLYESI